MSDVNPHNWLVAVDPPGRPNRVWRCKHCDATGPMQLLELVSCTFVYPPCKDCGQTPLCASSCIGVLSALATVRPPVGDA